MYITERDLLDNHLHCEPAVIILCCSCNITVGIVPIFCETLFSEVEEKRKEGSETEYQVLNVIA